MINGEQDGDSVPNEVVQLSLDGHIEADAFWCFQTLMNQVQDLFDLDGIQHAQLELHVRNAREGAAAQPEPVGMASALTHLSIRLRRLDNELWSALHDVSLDPQLPTYAFRWLLSLLSIELPPLRVATLWDYLLTETGTYDPRKNFWDAMSMIDFLLDLACAMLVSIREPLLQSCSHVPNDHDERKSSYVRAIRLLLHYPISVHMSTVHILAQSYRQRRLTSSLTGDVPELENHNKGSSLSPWHIPSNIGTSWLYSATTTQLSRQGSALVSQARKEWNQARSTATATITKMTNTFELDDDDGKANATDSGSASRPEQGALRPLALNGDAQLSRTMHNHKMAPSPILESKVYSPSSSFATLVTGTRGKSSSDARSAPKQVALGTVPARTVTILHRSRPAPLSLDSHRSVARISRRLHSINPLVNVVTVE